MLCRRMGAITKKAKEDLADGAGGSNCCRSRSGYGPYSPIGRYGSMNFHSESVT